jgi:hypothetical protein
MRVVAGPDVDTEAGMWIVQVHVSDMLMGGGSLITALVIERQSSSF